jgi:hypothetical protein
MLTKNHRLVISSLSSISETLYKDRSFTNSPRFTNLIRRVLVFLCHLRLSSQYCTPFFLSDYWKEFPALGDLDNLNVLSAYSPVASAFGFGSDLLEDAFVRYLQGDRRLARQIEAAYIVVTLMAGIATVSAFIYIYLANMDGSAKYQENSQSQCSV